MDDFLLAQVVITCIYIPKYGLFSLYNVTYIESLRVDHLALNNKPVCCSLGSISLTPRFPHLPIVLCVGLWPHELFPSYFGIFIGVILDQVTLCCWNFMGIASDTTRRYCLKANSLILCLLHSFCPCIYNVSWTFGVGEFCRCIHCDWTSQLCIATGYGFL